MHDMRLEVVVVPVSDVERARRFYADALGFRIDHDTRVGGDDRLVQLTPPGSACSIAIGTVRPSGDPVQGPPGALQGLQLVVADLRRAHAELSARGVPVTAIQVYERGALRPGRDEDELDNVGFCFFEDPDGNGWTIQQVRARG